MAVTVRNGQVPDALLAAAEGASGARLRRGAAASWAGVRRAVHARYGWWPMLTSAADAYRVYATQRRIFLDRYQTNRIAYAPGRYDMRVWDGTPYWRKPGTAAAAVPGTSNHGWGRAVDVKDIGPFTGRRYQQLAAVAIDLGWSNAEGRSVNEPWHWVYAGDLDTVSNVIDNVGPLPTVPDLTPIAPITPEDDDMPTIILAAEAGAYLLDGGTLLPLDRKGLADAERNGFKAMNISRDLYLQWIQRTSVGVLVRDNSNGAIALSVGGSVFVPVASMKQYTDLQAQGVPILGVEHAAFAKITGAQ